MSPRPAAQSVSKIRTNWAFKYVLLYRNVSPFCATFGPIISLWSAYSSSRNPSMHAFILISGANVLIKVKMSIASGLNSFLSTDPWSMQMATVSPACVEKNGLLLHRDCFMIKDWRQRMRENNRDDHDVNGVLFKWALVSLPTPPPPPPAPPPPPPHLSDSPQISSGGDELQSI